MIGLVEAYVLITSSVGDVRSVLDEFKGRSNVKDVRMVTGSFDLIVLAEAEDLSTLTNVVVDELRETEGVIDTSTAIVVE